MTLVLAATGSNGIALMSDGLEQRWGGQDNSVVIGVTDGAVKTLALSRNAALQISGTATICDDEFADVVSGIRRDLTDSDDPERINDVVLNTIRPCCPSLRIKTQHSQNGRRIEAIESVDDPDQPVDPNMRFILSVWSPLLQRAKTFILSYDDGTLIRRFISQTTSRRITAAGKLAGIGKLVRQANSRRDGLDVLQEMKTLEAIMNEAIALESQYDFPAIGGEVTRLVLPMEGGVG